MQPLVQGNSLLVNPREHHQTTEMWSQIGATQEMSKSSQKQKLEMVSEK